MFFWNLNKLDFNQWTLSLKTKQHYSFLRYLVLSVIGVSSCDYPLVYLRKEFLRCDILMCVIRRSLKWFNEKLFQWIVKYFFLNLKSIFDSWISVIFFISMYLILLYCHYFEFGLPLFGFSHIWYCIEIAQKENIFEKVYCEICETIGLETVYKGYFIKVETYCHVIYDLKKKLYLKIEWSKLSGSQYQSQGYLSPPGVLMLWLFGISGLIYIKTFLLFCVM